MEILQIMQKQIETLIKEKGVKDSKLIARKVINEFMLKLRKKKGGSKTRYQHFISLLEDQFNVEYGYKVNHHWEKLI